MIPICQEQQGDRTAPTRTTRPAHHDDTQGRCTTSKDNEPQDDCTTITCKDSQRFPAAKDQTTNAPRRHANMLRDTKRQETTCGCTPASKRIPTFPKDEDHTANAPRRHTNMLRNSETQGTTHECTQTTQNDSYFPKDKNHTTNA